VLYYLHASWGTEGVGNLCACTHVQHTIVVVLILHTVIFCEVLVEGSAMQLQKSIKISENFKFTNLATETQRLSDFMLDSHS
jgi:hypothetical protein